MRTTTNTVNTLSSAGERSLQGYSEMVRFSVPDSLLNERSLPAQTVKIPVEYAQQRNRLEYLKGLRSFKRKDGTLSDGPFMLNYLNKKRNIDQMRDQIREEIEQKIAEDKYYVMDYNVRSHPKRELRSNSVLLPNKKNILQYDPIQQEASEAERLTSNQTRRKSVVHSSSQHEQSNSVLARSQISHGQSDSVSSNSQREGLRSRRSKQVQQKPTSPASSDDSEGNKSQRKSALRNRKQSYQHPPSQYSDKPSSGVSDSSHHSTLPARRRPSNHRKQLQPIRQNDQQHSRKRDRHDPKPAGDSSEDEW